MKITDTFEIINKRDGTILSILNGDTRLENDASRKKSLVEIYNTIKDMEFEQRKTWMNQQIADGKYTEIFGVGATSTTDAKPVEKTPIECVQEGLEKLIDFFKEFDFEPNFRFVNTLSRLLSKKKSSAIEYINNYFELIDSSYKNEIKAKINSKEFKEILNNISKVAPTKTVNQRFKIYYGSQGTGKTTLAQTETENRCIVCNASMLPSDLMEDFGFKDGDAVFNRSLLRECMEQGKALVLDEINLLPFDSLRFLQGILDGKKEFNYKNETVHINDGFMIIGTMNLSVNGMVYGLPEPLVDRCFEMKKFNLDAQTLIGAIC